MSFIFCLLLLFSPDLYARILGESIAVSPHALPGDSDATSLALPGLQFHEFNDYFGKTDKLITGGAKANLLWVTRHFSAKLSFKGAYIQPILQTRNDQLPLDKIIGIHGEELNTSLFLSYTHYKNLRSNSPAIKFTVGGGYVDLGNHGLINLYRQIHNAVGSPIQDDKFGPKIHGSFRYFSSGIHFILPLAKFLNFQTGVSSYNSQAFYEYAYEAGIIFSANKSFAFSAKYQFIDQKRSMWWDLRDNRHQFIAGLRLFEYWTPSVMLVSRYVKGDQMGQLYLSPLSFTIPF
jgi:hypothetical protein